MCAKVLMRCFTPQHKHTQPSGRCRPRKSTDSEVSGDMSSLPHHAVPRNIYTRRDRDYDVEMGEACSPSKRFFDTFREKMSLRSRRNSINEQDEMEATDDDVELPPPYYDPPKEYFETYGSVPTESGYLSSNLRGRSRSDAAPQQSVQKIGTLVIFPAAPPPSPEWSYEGELPSVAMTPSQTPKRRSERHQSICVGEVEARKSGRHLPLLKMPSRNVASHHNQLYVDTKLATAAAASHSPNNLAERRSSKSAESAGAAAGRFHAFHPLSPTSMPRPGTAGRPRAASASIVMDGCTSPIGNFALVLMENGSLSTPTSPIVLRPEFGNILIGNPDAAYRLFMKAHLTYYLAPNSGLVANFDGQITVRQAFMAMMQNGFRAAAITNVGSATYLDLLSARDFIDMANKYFARERGIAGIKELEKLYLGKWVQMKQQELGRGMAYVSVMDSMYHMLEVMRQNKLHWIATIEPIQNSVMYCATQKRTLKYMHTHFCKLPCPSFMQEKPKDLGIGTWENIQKVCMSTLLIDVFRIMTEKDVSCVPIVDENNKLVSVFSQIDIFSLNIYERLESPMSEVLADLGKKPGQVNTCTEDDTVKTVTGKLVRAYIHRLMVVDPEGRLTGVISAQDLLRFMVFEPPVASDGTSIAEADSQAEAEAEVEAALLAEALAESDD